MEAVIFQVEPGEPFCSAGEPSFVKTDFCVETKNGKLHIKGYFPTSESRMLAFDDFRLCDGSCKNKSSRFTLSSKDEETLRPKISVFFQKQPKKD